MSILNQASTLRARPQLAELGSPWSISNNLISPEVDLELDSADEDDLKLDEASDQTNLIRRAHASDLSSNNPYQKETIDIPHNLGNHISRYTVTRSNSTATGGDQTLSSSQIVHESAAQNRSRMTILDEKNDLQSIHELVDARSGQSMINQVSTIDLAHDSHVAAVQAQQQQQLFVLLVMSLAIFIVIGLIIYNWFYRERKFHRSDKRSSLSSNRTKRSPCPSLGRLFSRPSSSHPSDKSADLFSEEDEIGNLLEKDTGVCITTGRSSNGELIQLLERRPPPILGASSFGVLDEDPDKIKVEASYYEEEKPKQTSASIVIFKKRIANSSLILAARSTKPKVKIATARLQKFIDHEADELRSKASKNPNSKWSIITQLLGPAKKEEKTVEMRADSDVVTAVQPTLDDHVKAGCRSDNQPTNLRAPTDHSIPNDSKKLSPSPAANEACSSISVCSLFSESPSIDHRTSIEPMNSNQFESDAMLCNACKIEPSYSGKLGPFYTNQSVNKLGGVTEINQRTCYSLSPSALQPQVPLISGPIEFGTADHMSISSRQASFQVQYEPNQTRAASVVGNPCLGDNASPTNCPRLHYSRYQDDKQSTGSITIDFGVQDLQSNNSSISKIAQEFQGRLLDPNSVCSATEMQRSRPTSHQHQFQPNSSPLQIEPDHGDQNQCACCNKHLTSNEYSIPTLRSNIGYNLSENADHRHAYLESRSACSMSEPLSSGSVSLGGSDSGFGTGPVLTNFCYSNNLCSCQTAIAQNQTINMMVQQPTGLNHPLTSKEAKMPESDRFEESAPQSNAIHSIDRQRPRWIQRTNRLRPLGLRSSPIELRTRHSCSSASVHPRRLTLAGDQVARNQIELNTMHNEGSADQKNIASAPYNHRASIASAERFGLAGTQQVFDYGHQRVGCYPADSVHQFNLQQLSDVSLYEQSSCEFVGIHPKSDKSHNSSSGGSSSGIGFSGSACTNTPTGLYPLLGRADLPATGIMQRQPSLTEPNLMPCMRYVGPQYGHHQLTSNMHMSNHSFASAGAPSRKFSLPVQLESQAAERLSPNRANLLFDENLQGNDSPSLANSPGHSRSPQVARTDLWQNASNPTNAPLQNCREPTKSPNFSSKRRSFGGQDSRRSSQTITRQTSFWLDDGDDDPNLSRMKNCEANATETKFKKAEEPEEVAPVFVPETGQSAAEVGLNPGAIDHDHTKEIDHPSSAHDSASGALKAPFQPDKRVDPLRVGPRRGRLSSSSTTSSTGSSPSPDSGRPSERILALQVKSSSISKRNLFSRLRSRRQTRPSSSNGTRLSALERFSSSSTTAKVASEFGLDLTGIARPLQNSLNPASPVRVSQSDEEQSKMKANDEDCEEVGNLLGKSRQEVRYLTYSIAPATIY